MSSVPSITLFSLYLLQLRALFLSSFSDCLISFIFSTGVAHFSCCLADFCPCFATFSYSSAVVSYCFACFNFNSSVLAPSVKSFCAQHEFCLKCDFSSFFVFVLFPDEPSQHFNFQSQLMVPDQATNADSSPETSPIRPLPRSASSANLQSASKLILSSRLVYSRLLDLPHGVEVTRATPSAGWRLYVRSCYCWQIKINPS